MKKNIVLEDIKNIVNELGKEANKFEGKTLLISGGGGFIGSYIISVISFLNRNIFKKTCHVISLDNYITGSRRGLLSSRKEKWVRQIEHNVIKPYKTRNKIDYIIHAAGIASPIYYRRSPLETIDVTICGVRNLLELAKNKKVRSFLYFSSSEIYGNPDPKFIPTPEDYKGNVSSIGPRSPYDESKRLGETICKVYFDLYKLPIKIVRPFNVYGPGMKPKDYRVLPMYLNSALENKPLPVHYPGRQTRTFCYISDAVTAFLKVLLSDKNGEVYNVGSNDEEINMYDLAKLFIKLYECDLKIKKISYPQSYPADEPQRRKPSLVKIKKDIHFRPKISLETGLSRYIAWSKQKFSV